MEAGAGGSGAACRRRPPAEVAPPATATASTPPPLPPPVACGCSTIHSPLLVQLHRRAHARLHALPRN